jgi:hypothetical protein
VIGKVQPQDRKRETISRLITLIPEHGGKGCTNLLSALFDLDYDVKNRQYKADPTRDNFLVLWWRESSSISMEEEHRRISILHLIFLTLCSFRRDEALDQIREALLFALAKTKFIQKEENDNGESF